MKNKKKIYIILGIVLFLIVVSTLLYFLVFKKDKKVKTQQVECNNITGGSYKLIFKSEGETLSDMNVCIACAPNSYEDLLEPTKEGYVFEGWFYDAALEKAVTVSNTVDIKPVAKKDKNACVVGYKDITLYAKWSRAGEKSIKISFDSNGGSLVDTIEVKCNDEDVATITNLPNSNKEGYNFVAWKDANEVPILEGALLTCNNDLLLTAAWEKVDNNNNNNKPSNNKKTTYKCEDGWTLDGTNCTKTYDASRNCPSGSYDVNGKCVEVTVSKKTADTLVCKNGEQIPGRNSCQGTRISSDSSNSCATAGGIWYSNTGECRTKYEETHTCPGNYIYLANPGQYNSNIHGESACYPIVQYTYSCSNSQDKLEGTKCIATVDAKLQ